MNRRGSCRGCSSSHSSCDNGTHRRCTQYICCTCSPLTHTSVSEVHLYYVKGRPNYLWKNLQILNFLHKNTLFSLTSASSFHYNKYSADPTLMLMFGGNNNEDFYSFNGTFDLRNYDDGSADRLLGQEVGRRIL